MAEARDLGLIAALYDALETEQTALRPTWRLADGLPGPIAPSLADILLDEDSVLVLGLLDEVPLGFAWGRSEPLLPQAGGRNIAVVRLIHTDIEARGVGIGAAMLEHVMRHFEHRGITLFDARVSPGHRDAKNFFESHGFKARLIVMNHDHEPSEKT
ncbi:MAG: GNAT family N-acetyltransferase [Acidimicrobiia bacterium]